MQGMSSTTPDRATEGRIEGIREDVASLLDMASVIEARVNSIDVRLFGPGKEEAQEDVEKIPVHAASLVSDIENTIEKTKNVLRVVEKKLVILDQNI